MTGPLYSSVVVLHVLAGVVGFGALGATGTYAAAVRRASARPVAPAVRRFFRPGPNWAGRAILAVPLLGGLLLFLGRGRDVGRAFPWIGLAIWVAATGVASAVLWPAERALQRHVAALADDGTGDGVPDVSALAAARRCERAAAVTSVLFAAALVVMVAQP